MAQVAHANEFFELFKDEAICVSADDECKVIVDTLALSHYFQIHLFFAVGDSPVQLILDITTLGITMYHLRHVFLLPIAKLDRLYRKKIGFSDRLYNDRSHPTTMFWRPVA